MHLLVNDDWRYGISTSIQIAISVIGDEYDGVFILLADQVGVQAQALKDMRNQWYDKPESIIDAKYKNLCVAPAIFPRAFFSGLKNLIGDKSPRGVIAQNIDKVCAFPMPEAHWDIDTELQLND
ncbi:MAG: CTP:molybdopterin cytidylyltransferase MocA [Lentisphaeria bacterium]